MSGTCLDTYVRTNGNGNGNENDSTVEVETFGSATAVVRQKSVRDKFGSEGRFDKSSSANRPYRPKTGDRRLTTIAGSAVLVLVGRPIAA